MSKKSSPGRTYRGNADQLQARELQRNGYTRPSGGTKRSQAKDLNRDKKAQSGS